MHHHPDPSSDPAPLPIGRLLLSLLAAAVLGGCSVGPEAESTPATTPGAPVVGAGPVVPESAAAKLNYTVDANANDVFSRAVADQVKTETEGALNESGYRGVGTNPDIRVSLNVSAKEFDRSGNYYRYEGTAKGVISRAFDEKLLAARTLNVRGSRGLGEGPALDNLGNELATETTEWVKGAATPEIIGLAASDITVKLPWHKDNILNRKMDDYARRFVRAVKDVPGVTSVILTAEDPASRTLVFRVVYLPDRFPVGLLNHLEGLSGKDDLNLN